MSARGIPARCLLKRQKGGDDFEGAVGEVFLNWREMIDAGMPWRFEFWFRGAHGYLSLKKGEFEIVRKTSKVVRIREKTEKMH